MKKYKSILDAILLLGMGAIAFLAIAPNTLLMPTSFQMVLLAVVLALLAGFLALLWREQPSDEREAQNQALASRMAYIVGSVVLIAALVVQSLRHELDAAIPVALLAMIATKVLVQRTKDDQ
jgi:cobalamin synthase